VAHIKIGDKQLEYVWHGPGPADAPTLIFLHEGLGCVAMWRDFPERLAAQTGCGALVYSRAGYGNSDPCELPRPIRFMHDEALVTLPQVLDAFQIREAILVGHSDGGSIALIHAGGTRTFNHEDTKSTKTADRNESKGNKPSSLWPQTLMRGLILEAPHVFVEEIGLESIRAIAEEYRTAIANVPSSERASPERDAGRMPANRPQDAGAPSVLKRRLARYHGENVDATFGGWNDVWLNPDFQSWNIEEYLPQIQIPVLLIQGKDDRYGTFAQFKAIEAGCQGPVRTVLLADCGHSPHLDQPARALEAMREFVAELK
jgi:pimeloyl-ACP methyl ester carboxylesterase